MSTPQNGPHRRRLKARRAARLSRWRLTPERQAIDWALSRYNHDPTFRQTTVEVGVVLCADRHDGSLRPGRDVPGPNGGQVQPYTAGGLASVLQSYAGVGDVFQGDYHCHVGSGLSWTDHVPSPADVCHQSCLCDLWLLQQPLVIQPGVQITFLPTSPRFQLVQANAFGDVFLIRRNPRRARLQTPAAQQQTMAAIQQAYGFWHVGAYARLDALDLPLRHGDFVSTIRAELPAMNATLAGRARIDFVANKSYVSDDPDFLE